MTSRSAAADITSLATLGASEGNRRPDPTYGAERQVLTDPLVADVADLRLRASRLVGAGVALDLASAGAGHQVELDVISRAHHVAEVGKHVGERLDGLDGVEVERGHASQRHLGEDPECAEPDAGHAEQFGFVLFIGAQHRAVAGDDLEADDVGGTLGNSTPVPCVAVDVAPAIDCTLMSPRLAMARPSSVRRSLRSRSRIPACTVTSLPSTDKHLIHGIERQQVTVGHRSVGERVRTGDHLDPFAGRCGHPHHADHLVGEPRLVDLRGRQRWLPAQFLVGTAMRPA